VKIGTYHSLLRPPSRLRKEEARDVKVRTLTVSITVIMIILIGSSHSHE
jgi:hypothetical protein